MYGLIIVGVTVAGSTPVFVGACPILFRYKCTYWNCSDLLDTTTMSEEFPDCSEFLYNNELISSWT